MLTLKYKFRALVIMAMLAFVGTIVSESAKADPCGMVPPIYVGLGSPITRIGLQKTYVFHKDGVETFVIRPGFTGNVDNFGMLIPFPTPPELRKVPDNVFEQITHAIDPPEVVVDLRWRRRAGLAMPMSAMKKEAAMDIAEEDGVQVLKEEAVGMYEVAVLAAGSAESLKKWMDKKGYQYPNGMNKVTDEYIQLGWCFVAVKTKVGKKSDADPRPGRRQARPQMPAGGVFDGHVQGMGFRFKSEKLVVPMRLSAFNGDDLRNVVYLLTDGPRKIRAIPEEYVMRQLTGQQLYDNLTRPLPLRIIGGTEKDIPEYRRKSLVQERDPAPKNGIAKELFASDLLAVATGNLSLEHEEMEKELLRIGEHFGLRGPDADAINAASLKKMRDQTTKDGLESLKSMTMTVVDGDFPREVIQNQNLTFAEYKMPQSRNSQLNYDSTRFGAGEKKEGILKVGAIDWQDVDRQIVSDHRKVRVVTGSILGLALLGLLGACFKQRPSPLFIIAILIGMVSTVAVAQEDSLKDTTPNEDLIKMLGDSQTAAPAIAAIAKRSKLNDRKYDQMVRLMVDVAKTDGELPRRGWAVAALAEIGGQSVDEELLDIHADESVDQLVRTWAAAARVSMTRSTNGLIEKANLIGDFPALGRPIGMRLVEAMTDEGEKADVEKILGVSLKVPQLQTSLAPAVISFGPEKLSTVMIRAEDTNVRRLAAGYLGSIATQGRSPEVAELVETELNFLTEANDVPWQGGALFVPSIQWGKADAQKLVGALIRWHLWCDIHNKPQEQTQIHNNIRSLGLARAAGYTSPGWNNASTPAWLAAWGTAVGKQEIEAILREQNVLNRRKYSDVLDQLN